ncbi:thioesterase family protein [Aspergillus japonicus CBS 114.51]|uniref:Thioesterase family protein n=1 Tax=Aspergillus japonicus CBS 114.51 TaxID=1448312 RepID=A0A8T8WJW3_ASPJA|nr:thioesterase family protein [Aspergillus japonicus CBS 114.51]RAH76115.1 thioesterase family protein [Aspergillus japonicus CBS 114.51]
MSPSISILNQPHPPALEPFRATVPPVLTRLLHHPEYFPIRTWSRIFKSDSGEDGYFARTLASPLTIPHVCTLRRQPELLAPLPDIAPVWPAPNSVSQIENPDLYFVLQLATPGISGHPSTAHGGLLATCIDEAMSYAVALHAPETGAAGALSAHHPRGMLYTAQLDIRYRAPVAVPGYALVQAKVLARVGRKFWVHAQILQPGEADEDPLRVTTDAIAFWLQTKAAL